MEEESFNPSLKSLVCTSGLDSGPLCVPVFRAEVIERALLLPILRVSSPGFCSHPSPISAQVHVIKSIELPLLLFSNAIETSNRVFIGYISR